MITPSRLVCLRHGESANVVAGAAGALPTAPLTARGRDQASAAAAALVGADNAAQSTWQTTLLPGGRPAAIYASCARRARETAEIIAAARGIRPTIVADLAEVDIGELEGATDAPTRARTAEVLRSWVVDGDLDQRVAHGEDGHAVAVATVRCRSCAIPATRVMAAR